MHAFNHSFIHSFIQVFPELLLRDSETDCEETWETPSLEDTDGWPLFCSETPSMSRFPAVVNSLVFFFLALHSHLL